MITGTVALPVYNSDKILWLCLESLCRQEKPQDGWELIVFEEMHPTMVGEPYIRQYEERLKKVGCEQIKYITCNQWVSLSRKWVRIAKEAESTSVYFTMCAADNYYHPWMLKDAESTIKSAEWCLLTKGYFYDFHSDKVIMYNYPTIVGLAMTANIERVRKFPEEDLKCSIDSWFFRQLRSQGEMNVFMDGSEHYKNMLCTNGLNNISKGRYRFFEDIQSPFFQTDVRLNEIVPEDIYRRMMNITMALNVNDDLGCPQ